jgi:hypothetical protein
MAWYTWDDLAREAGFLVLPEGGAWVAIVGCPAWPRGQRLVKVHREIGIRHMDIYWASKETFVAKFTVNRFGRRDIDLPAAIAHEVSRGRDLDEALARAVEEVQSFVLDNPNQSRWQTSLVTINHPCPEEVRFYNGEVRVFAPNTIRELLAADWVDVLPFGETTMPVLEDAAREIADALQVDGLSEAEAYQQILGMGIVDPGTQFLPQWFYRPKGAFRDQFCEEER